MKLVDIQPLEKWVALEKEIVKRSGLSGSIFDTEGIRITDYKKWVNDLCPLIKANQKGQTFICASAHQNIANIAMQSRESVIEECDAGMVKIVVPIFLKDEFLGGAGGCGLLLDEGEVETFLINKLTDIDDAELEKLSADIKAISMEEAQETAQFIQSEIARIVDNYLALNG